MPSGCRCARRKAMTAASGVTARHLHRRATKRYPMHPLGLLRGAAACLTHRHARRLHLLSTMTRPCWIRCSTSTQPCRRSRRTHLRIRTRPARIPHTCRRRPRHSRCRGCRWTTTRRLHPEPLHHTRASATRWWPHSARLCRATHRCAACLQRPQRRRYPLTATRQACAAVTLLAAGPCCATRWAIARTARCAATGRPVTTTMYSVNIPPVSSDTVGGTSCQ